jgi:hypothetical protein
MIPGRKDCSGQARCNSRALQDSRSHVITRVIRRKANRRHIIGDNCGRTAGGATLLVRALDEILGTHTIWWRSTRLDGPDVVGAGSRASQAHGRMKAR